MEPIFIGYFPTKEGKLKIEVHCKNENCRFNKELGCRSTNIVLSLKPNRKEDTWQISCSKMEEKVKKVK